MAPRWPLLAGVALVLGSRLASAQASSDPGFQLGAFAALSKGRAAESATLGGGILARARLTGALGVEALLGYRHESYESGGARVLRVDELPLQGSVQLFLLYRRPVQPYVLAGASYTYVRWHRLAPLEPGSGGENRFGFHGGLGITARLGPRFTAFAEVRYALLDVGPVLELPGGRKSDYWHTAAGALVSF